MRLRLSTVEESIQKKEKVIDGIKNGLDQKEGVLHEKTTNYSVEDGALKVRLENLKRAQVEMQKSIKPQLN